MSNSKRCALILALAAFAYSNLGYATEWLYGRNGDDTILYGHIFWLYYDRYEDTWYTDDIGDGICVYDRSYVSPYMGNYADRDTWALGEDYYALKADPSIQASYDDLVYPADWITSDKVLCGTNYYICMDCTVTEGGLNVHYEFPSDQKMALYGDFAETSDSVGGSDDIRGWDNNDIIEGGYGWDYLYGYGGNDWIRAWKGNDHAYAGTCTDVTGLDEYLYGGDGTDYLFGSSCDDYLYGGADGDWLEGSAGADELYSGTGSDYLFGGDGNDILSSGGDDGVWDNCNGQNNSDTCYCDYTGDTESNCEA